MDSNSCPHCKTSYSVKKGRKLNIDEIVGAAPEEEEEE